MTPARIILLPLLLLLAVCAQSFGQIDVRMEPVRRDYILGETAALRLTITNYTDSTVELKSTPDQSWLHLNHSH